VRLAYSGRKPGSAKGGVMPSKPCYQLAYIKLACRR
jgi:hypothetical protein